MGSLGFSSLQKTADGGVHLFDLRIRLHLRSLDVFDFSDLIRITAAQFDQVSDLDVHRRAALHAPGN